MIRKSLLVERGQAVGSEVFQDVLTDILGLQKSPAAESFLADQDKLIKSALLNKGNQRSLGTDFGNRMNIILPFTPQRRMFFQTQQGRSIESILAGNAIEIDPVCCGTMPDQVCKSSH